ncbi:MAG: autorepressor SdpR family transcription factor [Candidatus Sulfotelmatobacter sp.]
MASSNEAFKAISDPTRREILRLLRKGEMTAGDLAERFDMTKPTMSHHFSVLKEADLLTSRREGQTIWYGLNTTVVQDLMAWAIDLIGGDAQRDGDHTPAKKPGSKS